MVGIKTNKQTKQKTVTDAKISPKQAKKQIPFLRYTRLVRTFSNE